MGRRCIAGSVRCGQRADQGRVTPQKHEEPIRLRREIRRATEDRGILDRTVSTFPEQLW
jgi:hypothetical protein